ncbi:MAG: tRNA (N(6)-L-threonylcarbamoyladenosine(37)-C(2))-methylthiotransferase MtaB [Candidatus Omnitrophota bacterium]
MDKPTFTIKTLGCKVNQYEAQVLRESLVRLGFQESVASGADVAIINSCTVTGKADSKTKRLIRKVKKDNPETKIFVTGCYVVFDDDIETAQKMPEVYKIVPNESKMELPRILGDLYGREGSRPREEEKVSGFDSHTRAFLKIQDGCDRKCSYCKVNLVRGPSRSKEKGKIIDELTQLVDSGYKEVVLTGICLGSWKGEKGEGFSDLLSEVDALGGDFRIRLSSIEPDCIDEGLIDFLAGSKRVCRHLHVPLQSGSDRILKLMNRKYDSAWFKEVIENLRARMPFIGITMDVISGFPGEDDEDFRKTVNLIHEIRPGRIHVFGYSDRKGTRAFKMKDKVASGEIKSRVSQLIDIGEKFRAEFCKKFVGKEVEVLVEERLKDMALAGYTGEYVRVKLKDLAGQVGDIVRVKASHADQKSPTMLVL